MTALSVGNKQISRFYQIVADTFVAWGAFGAIQGKHNSKFEFLSLVASKHVALMLNKHWVHYYSSKLNVDKI